MLSGLIILICVKWIIYTVIIPNHNIFLFNWRWQILKHGTRSPNGNCSRIILNRAVNVKRQNQNDTFLLSTETSRNSQQVHQTFCFFRSLQEILINVNILQFHFELWSNVPLRCLAWSISAIYINTHLNYFVSRIHYQFSTILSDEMNVVFGWLSISWIADEMSSLKSSVIFPRHWTNGEMKL